VTEVIIVRVLRMWLPEIQTGEQGGETGVWLPECNHIFTYFFRRCFFARNASA
jgi:hypothetical protein